MVWYPGAAYAVGAVPAAPFSAARTSAATMEGMLDAIEPSTQLDPSYVLSSVEPALAMGKRNYTREVVAFQKSGQYGATVVGPAIDASGAADVTQPLTHKAWDLNGQMNSMSSWGNLGYGYVDMQKAKTLAWQMLVLYKQAIASGWQRLLQREEQMHGGSPATATRQPGVSALPVPLQSATQALLAAIQSAKQAGESPMWSRERGQSNVMWQPTSKFQRAYNKAMSGNLLVDGVFGPETSAALQHVAGTNTMLATRGPMSVV
jgi:hypothetical protein